MDLTETGRYRRVARNTKSIKKESFFYDPNNHDSVITHHLEQTSLGIKSEVDARLITEAKLIEE